MTKIVLKERIPMELNLGHPEQLIGWATVSRDTETERTTIEIELHETASASLMDFEKIAEIKALGFVGLIRRSAAVCECGHELSAHIPRQDRPFAWPCATCGCDEYKEVSNDG